MKLSCSSWGMKSRSMVSAASCATATTFTALSSSSVNLQRPTTTHIAASTSQRRFYYYKYKKDFVPEGGRTSQFQSSWSPSERKKVIQEYALAPLFGTRYSAIVLGSKQSPQRFARNKFLLGPLLDEILGLKNGTVEVGETQWLSDGCFPRHACPQYRRMDARTGEVLANCLVSVHLPEDFGPVELLDAGSTIADAVYGGYGVAPAASGSGTPNGHAISVVVDGGDCSTKKLPIDERLERDCGITYCELEVPDLNDHRWERLLGTEVDPDEAMAALDRWDARVAFQLKKMGQTSSSVSSESSI